jgi:hypothetical protein
LLGMLQTGTIKPCWSPAEKLSRKLLESDVSQCEKQIGIYLRKQTNQILNNARMVQVAEMFRDVQKGN